MLNSMLNLAFSYKHCCARNKAALFCMTANKSVHTELNLMVTLRQTSQVEDFYNSSTHTMTSRTTFKERQAQVSRYVNRPFSDGMSFTFSLSKKWFRVIFPHVLCSTDTKLATQPHLGGGKSTRTSSRS